MGIVGWVVLAVGQMLAQVSWLPPLEANRWLVAGPLVVVIALPVGRSSLERGLRMTVGVAAAVWFAVAAPVALPALVALGLVALLLDLVRLRRRLRVSVSFGVQGLLLLAGAAGWWRAAGLNDLVAVGAPFLALSLLLTSVIMADEEVDDRLIACLGLSLGVLAVGIIDGIALNSDNGGPDAVLAGLVVAVLVGVDALRAAWARRKPVAVGAKATRS